MKLNLYIGAALERIVGNARDCLEKEIYLMKQTAESYGIQALERAYNADTSSSLD